MCDISKKTRRKSVTVYKAVLIDGKHFKSVFSRMIIKTGEVSKRFLSHDKRHHDNDYSHLYNENMVGRTSGFKSKEDAFALAKSMIENSSEMIKDQQTKLPYDVTVIKMVLGGNIMQGTTCMISDNISDKNKTFAGTKILSFEEINN